MITIRLNWGRYAISAMGETDADVVQQISLWGELPKVCPQCNQESLTLKHRHWEGFDYYSIQCLDCWIEMKLGQKRDVPGALFPHRDFVEIKVAKDGAAPPQEAPPQRQHPATRTAPPRPQPAQGRPPPRSAPHSRQAAPQRRAAGPPPPPEDPAGYDYDPEKDPGAGEEAPY